MKRILTVLLLTVLVLVMFTGCGKQTEAARNGTAAADGLNASDGKNAAEPTFEDYNGKKIGVMTGSVHEKFAEKFFPDSPVSYYSEYSDLTEAVKNGNIAGFTADLLVAKMIAAETDGLKLIISSENMDPCALAFPKTEKGAALRDDFNAFLAGIKADGTFDEIYNMWINTDAQKQPVDAGDLLGNEPVLVFATSATFAPFSYLLDNRIAGLDVDLAVRFCRARGYGIRIETTSTMATIAGLAAGMYDFIGSGITTTEERRENMNFSEPDYIPTLTLVVKAPETGAKAKQSLWESIRSSFEKNFIREQRWKLILQGVYTTVVLSIASAVLGTVLGFLICLLRRSKNGLLRTFAKCYIRLLQGTPMLVFLMILFYVVFARSPLTGEMVAIIAFAMNFAAYVSEIMRTGIEAVDAGQTEAALAIGFTPAQAFLRIVLPQAARHFLPVYRGEFISLVKSTSIVGYIAVQDLTKMSDIIRSRTYDAFFPLIVTAVIYFIISGLLTRLLQLIQVRIEPNRKKRGVKGVKMQ